jgi:DNA-binding NtrC family response regulator
VLRVLDKGEFYTVGGTEEIKVDVRVIAATNKELEREIEKGTFREDLFYRLNTITIPVPPLRERRDDIPLLLDHFLHFYCDENNVLLKKFAPDALLFLKSYEWKGNVRELKSLVEKLVILTESEMIGRLKVLDALKKTPVRTWTYQVETLQEMRERTEREHISYVLRSCNGNITNAAIILDLNRVNLYRKMKKYGMERGTGGSRQ